MTLRGFDADATNSNHDNNLQRNEKAADVESDVIDPLAVFVNSLTPEQRVQLAAILNAAKKPI